MDGIEREIFQILERSLRHELHIRTYPDRSYSAACKTVDGEHKSHGQTIRDAVQQLRRQANI